MNGPKAVVTDAYLAGIDFGEILSFLCLSNVFIGTQTQEYILIENSALFCCLIIYILQCTLLFQT